MQHRNGRHVRPGRRWVLKQPYEANAAVARVFGIDLDLVTSFSIYCTVGDVPTVMVTRYLVGAFDETELVEFVLVPKES